MRYNVKHITNGTRQTVQVVKGIIELLQKTTISDLAGAHEISLSIVPIPEEKKE